MKTRGISKSTVRRLFRAPRKSCKAAKWYKNLILAKVPPKRNNRRRPDADAQFCNSRVRQLREFAAHFSADTMVWSCDNKNKVNIGVVATNRQIKIRKFFWEEDAPNYSDHDFPLGYKLTPMGYMELPHIEPKQVVKDMVGRPHYRLSQSGPLHIINRAQAFQSSTVEPHVNDLIRLIGRKGAPKPILILVVDNGPDWTPASVLNCLYFVRLWKSLKLDALFVCSFCPKYSAFNPIEHSWSVCSNAITAITLPAVVPGEELPPCRQNIGEEIRRQKDAAMYDSAMELLCVYWNRAKWGGVNIDSSFQRCLSDSYPFNVHEMLKLKLQKATSILNDANLLDEMRFMIAHIERRVDFLAVKKCQDKSCDYCTDNPGHPNEAMKFLTRHSAFPSPIPDAKYSGHYYSFLDILGERIELPVEPDQHMKRYQKIKSVLGNAMCGQCRLYCFTSKTDQVKHNRIFHTRNLSKVSRAKRTKK